MLNYTLSLHSSGYQNLIIIFSYNKDALGKEKCNLRSAEISKIIWVFIVQRS